MKILVCGSRTWTDRDAIYKALRQVAIENLLLPSEMTIISGAARGADSLAADIGRQLGCTVIEFPAKWNIYGKRAGFIRNQQMLDEGHPDLVLAFWLNASRGTQDMVNRATKAHVPVRVIGKEVTSA